MGLKKFLSKVTDKIEYFAEDIKEDKKKKRLKII